MNRKTSDRRAVSIEPINHAAQTGLSEYLATAIAVDIDEERGGTPLVCPILISIRDGLKDFRKPGEAPSIGAHDHKGHLVLNGIKSWICRSGTGHPKASGEHSDIEASVAIDIGDGWRAPVGVRCIAGKGIESCDPRCCGETSDLLPATLPELDTTPLVPPRDLILTIAVKVPESYTAASRTTPGCQADRGNECAKKFAVRSEDEDLRGGGDNL
jgi:hypothetical protein